MSKSLGLFVLVLLTSSVGCAQWKRPLNVSIRGNYVLAYRELPNGARVMPPDIGGMMNLTRDTRNFNVYWMENGKMVSISSISHYTIDEHHFTEDASFYAARLPAGTGPAYQTEPMKGTSDVTVEGSKVVFQFPLHDEPSVEFTRDGLTATRPGAFVDHWKRVE